MFFRRYFLFAILMFASLFHLSAQDSSNSFSQVNLVSDDSDFNPEIIDPNMEDAWGLSVRPAGAGGHFWIDNAYSGTTSTFIGDVTNNGIFTPLYQDGLTNITVDQGNFADSGHSIDTGLVYNAASDFTGQPTEFPVSGETINFNTGAINSTNATGSAKFVFVTEDGAIDAWRSNTTNGMPQVVNIIDYSVGSTGSNNPFGEQNPYGEAPVYSGVTMSTNLYSTSAYKTNAVGGSGNLLFATDFRDTTSNNISVFNNQWSNVTSSFHFQTPSNLTYVDPDDHSTQQLHPFNIADLGKNLFVAYAGWNATGDEGQEQLSGAGIGHVVEYNEQGQLVKDFVDDGKLNSPWGMTIAPASFGKFGGDLLVSNFGDGTIAAFNLTTGDFVDYLNDANGDPISIDGIWGLTFGNGLSLGDSNSLYFTAGPNAEQNGLFGKLTVDPVPEPSTYALLSLGVLVMIVAARRRHA